MAAKTATAGKLTRPMAIAAILKGRFIRRIGWSATRCGREVTREWSW
jgi:hypothetical protein